MSKAHVNEKKYLDDIMQIEESLSLKKELFDTEKFSEFKQITSSLRRNLETAESDSKKLRIGIVGAVKAGKSSFLNALIFGGDEYLPKAATPMTAALTKITYSEKPKASIHFYTSEDWDTIVEQSSMYDDDLEDKYNAYCEQINDNNLMYSYSNSSPARPKSKEDYEKSEYKCKSENLRGAKELTKMVTDNTISEKLGGKDEIEGDIISKLNDYVGANGHYTPIVNYVELQVDNPSVKDIEIVDTPGLNDPIVSRGIRTKIFLDSCDVVLLLSPCSQFMDANTVRLMTNSLPDAGVREILVVGSKLDSGLLNEDDKDFRIAYKKSIESYKKQFEKNLSEVKKEGRHLELLNKMSADKVLFISSICFAIDKKIKKNIELDESENIVYNNLHKSFPNFEDELFLSLCGINNVGKSLNQVLDRKIQIMEDKNSNLLNDAKNNHLRILEKILKETVSSRTKLESVSAVELKQRTDNIRDAIDLSRDKLGYIFDYAVIKCDEKVNQLLPQLIVELSRHEKISEKSSSHEEIVVKKVGIFKKEIVRYNVTDHFADTSEVITNIKNYSSGCLLLVNNEFKYIFNKEEFAQKIKEVIMSAFMKGKKEFGEDDILLPLQNILAKISIPYIELDFKPYIYEVETKFSGGYAQNNEIHSLKTLQTKLLDKMQTEIKDKLKTSSEEIKKILKEQAVSFADKVKAEFCNELIKLQNQVKEKEEYIKKYREFADDIHEIKSKISSM